MAAFANGVMIRYLELNDTCLAKSAGHPSDMIGGLIPLAEGVEADGPSLLAAVVIAYEVYCGLCASVALQPKHLDQGLCAALGAAAGASRLLGLSLEEAGNALGLALAPNIPLYATRRGVLSDWKACAGPNGVRNGLFAALLARDGVSGPSEAFEGTDGLFDVTGRFEFVFGTGPGLHIGTTHIKYYPVCYHGQSAVDAAVRLHGEGIPVDAIADIHVETYATAVTAMAENRGKWTPTTRETADHSLPFSVAVSLLNGKLGTDDYQEERLEDAGTVALMEKVRVSDSPEMTADYPRSAQTRITVQDTGGATYEALQKIPKGNAGNPLSDTELETKLRMLCPANREAETVQKLLEVAWSLEDCRNVGVLVDAIDFR
jgi:2-methylcitrate dehydratase